MKRIYTLLGILLAVIAAAILFYRSLNRTIPLPVDAFKLERPNEIDAILMSANGGSGQYLKFEKRQGNWWVSNNKTTFEEADTFLLNQMLTEVMSKARVSHLVSDSAKENVVKDMAQSAVKVIFYKKGKEYKTMYVGNQTPDHRGTYMFIPNSDRPAIVKIGNMDMFVSGYFRPDIKEWLSPVMLSFNSANIRKCEIIWHQDKANSFTIEQDKDGNVFLFNGQVQKISNANAQSLRGFLERFSNLQREHGEQPGINNNKNQLDSIFQAGPFFTMVITNFEGKSKKLNLYHMKVSDETYSLVDELGNAKENEIEKFWGNVNQEKKLWVFQDLVLGKCMKKLSDLMR